MSSLPLSLRTRSGDGSLVRFSEKGATIENSKAAIGYDYCNKLFAAGKKYAGLSDAVRKTARRVGAGPLLEAYWCWVETLEPVPGSKLAEAVAYALNQKPYLSAFLEHGEVDISNNFAENAIRPFTLGRKIGCSTIRQRARIPVRSSKR